MRCLYINRDSAVGRRRNVEASFSAAAPPGWELVRIQAVEGSAGEAPGSLTPAERGCWLSHLRAITHTADDDEHVLIVEDDTRFARRAFEVLPRMLAAVPDCDLLFSEVTLIDINLMASLARRWNGLAAKGEFLLHNLQSTRFASTSAYMVRGSAKRRLAQVLEDPAQQSEPLDLALSRLIQSGRLKARLCFPFLTAPSPDADSSSIQDGAFELRAGVFHAFRRLMFVDRDLAACRAEAERLSDSHGDEGARLTGLVLGALISDRFPDTF